MLLRIWRSFNTCVVTNASTGGIFGMDVIGLSVVLGCKAKDAAKIVVFDSDAGLLQNGFILICLLKMSF